MGSKFEDDRRRDYRHNIISIMTYYYLTFKQMKKLLIVIGSLFLVGCVEVHEALTNEEIIIITKQCTEAGLDTREWTVGYKITKITCTNSK